MPLEFALRSRFDLTRPAPRRRLSGFQLHPLVLPIGAYWFALAGLAYALFIHRAPVDVAERAVGSGDSPGTNAPSEPAIQSPSSAGMSQTDTIQGPAKQEPNPVPWVEPLQDEPRSDQDLDAQDLDSVSRSREPADTADDRVNRKRVSRQTPPPVVQDEVSAKARSLEHTPVDEPAPPRSELAREAEPEQSPRGETQTGSLPSCEAAAATANQSIDLGSARGAPDLTRDAFAGVLEHGAYLTRCAIPPRTALEVCAAVRDGAVVGVTVTTEPRDAAINACVRRAVTALRFPRSSQLDITRTRFDRVR
jgi:hypothetical protein